MKRYILDRVIQAILAVLAVSVIVFFLGRLSGDPVEMLLSPDATEKDRAILSDDPCCLIRKCYPRDRWREEDEGEGLSMFWSLFSMASLSTKGLSFSSCLERTCFMSGEI
jgi:hypothetical protein